MRAMEELGIGRPSTYAPTVFTITTRGYVHPQGRALVPSELGEVVTDLLSEHFPKVLEVQFTARMEEELDGVEEGKEKWTNCVREFYAPFSKALALAQDEMRSVKKTAEPTNEICPQCGKPIVLKWGRNGKFFSCSGFPACRYARAITTGVACPEPGCKGELVRRRSKRGFFYGCSSYPQCRHIEKHLPPPQGVGGQAPSASSGQAPPQGVGGQGSGPL